MRRAAILLFTLLAAVVAAAPDAHAKTHALEGRWDLVMERPRMEPETCHALLVLSRDGKAWNGTITFRRVLYARTTPLTDIRVKGKKIEFALDSSEFEIEMSGAIKKGAFTGDCKWSGKTYKWSAERAPDAAVVERFERGLASSDEWPQVKAEDVGIDGETLDELIRQAEAAQSDGLLVLKNGQVVCERYFGGSQEPIFAMSVTKFVAALAVAKLLDEEKIESVDQPLSTWFPKWKDGLRGQVTLRHVLDHTSGIAHDQLAGKLNREKRQVEWVLSHEVTTEPGTEYSYNNDAIALLTGVIREAAGMPTDEYVDKRIFEPLGIEQWWWKRDDAGDARTYADLRITLRDLTKIGRLVADGGTWGKKQIIEPETIALFASPSNDAQPHQGLIWQLLRDEDGKEVIGVEHTGYLGQFLTVLPGDGVVGVRMRRVRDEATDNDPARNFGAFRSLLIRAVR